MARSRPSWKRSPPPTTGCTRRPARTYPPSTRRRVAPRQALSRDMLRRVTRAANRKREADSEYEQAITRVAGSDSPTARSPPPPRSRTATIRATPNRASTITDNGRQQPPTAHRTRSPHSHQPSSTSHRRAASRPAPPAPGAAPAHRCPPSRTLRSSQPHRPRRIVEHMAPRRLTTCRLRRRGPGHRAIARACDGCRGSCTSLDRETEPRARLAGPLAAEPRLGTHALRHRPATHSHHSGSGEGERAGFRSSHSREAGLPAALPAILDLPAHADPRAAAPRTRRSP